MKRALKTLEKSQKEPKIIVVVGPTASGKSALAVRIARAVGGEIISADSRQIYTGLDIGSGKITPEEMRGVPHHLLDVVSPKRRAMFTVAEFQRTGQKIIAEIIARGNVPIICGGTGFYIQALVDDIVLPDVGANPKLRAALEKKSTAALCKMLEKLDLRRYKEIDKNNRRRIIRAIEIAKAIGKVPTLKEAAGGKSYNPIFIGLTMPEIELKKKIKKRLDARLEQGMVKEVRNLRKKGITWKRLEQFGLEYRALAHLLQKKITLEEMTQRLETEIWQFSKRQMTWFKRDERITWFHPKDWTAIKKSYETFLRKR